MNVNGESKIENCDKKEKIDMLTHEVYCVETVNKRGSILKYGKPCKLSNPFNEVMRSVV